MITIIKCIQLKLHRKKEELIQKKRIYWNQKRFQNVNSKTRGERKRNKQKDMFYRMMKLK